MSKKLGRNDPCHCGSGKKYKKCHMAADEQEAAQDRRTSVYPPGEDEEQFEVPPNEEREVRQFLRQFSATAGPRRKGMPDPAFAKALLQYMEHGPELQAAYEALDAHMPEFEKLFENDQVYIQRVMDVFAEERYAPFYFTPEEIQRAFDKFGEPPHGDSDPEKSNRYFGKVFKYLVSKDRREQIALTLFSFLPEYVREGRFMDGLIVKTAAAGLTESIGESDPFLFHMFFFGAKAWDAAQRARADAVLLEMGMTPERLQAMNLEEVQAWAREQETDPARKAKLETILEAYPEIMESAEKSFRALQQDIRDILQREDAYGLLLPVEDVLPWARSFADKFESLSGPNQKTPSSEELHKVFMHTLEDMEKAIFSTDEKAKELFKRLREYEANMRAAGQEDVSQKVGLIFSVIGDDYETLTAQYFMTAVCFLSLRRALKELGSVDESAPTGQIK